MLVNQTLLYSISNNTNNIRFKLCKNSFNAVWKKWLKGAHSSLRKKWGYRTFVFFCLQFW